MEEIESFIIANDIKDKVNHHYKVFDNNKLRDITYKDFCILMDRTSSFDIYKKVAKANKDTKYYTYTKNFKLLEGQKLPSNLIINKSDYGTSELIEKSNEFLPINMNTFKAVTPEEMELIKADKKKAKYICHGESCSTCKMCTVKKGITIYCEIH